MQGKIEDGVFVVRFPRSDLKVKIDDEAMPTALGFSSWAGWKSLVNETILMGDLVVLEKEINPVISTLAEAKIEVTALHNHFLGEEPRLMYIHIYGKGKVETLAHGLLNALEKTATPMPQSKAMETAQPLLTLDTKKIEQIIGHPGYSGGGIFKITLTRPGVKMHGMELTSSMGINSWVAFVGTDERAHIAGDIAMTASEVTPVILALRKHGVNVVAVHSHMLDDEPHLFFLHYWGSGKAEDLARAFREAMDHSKSIR